MDATRYRRTEDDVRQRHYAEDRRSRFANSSFIPKRHTHMTYLAYSPNQRENSLSVDDAYAQMQSANHRGFIEMARDAAKMAGMKSDDILPSIGGWYGEGGVPLAEPSVFHNLGDQVDPDKAAYLGAWYGILGNQHNVSLFVEHPNGPDKMHQVFVPAHHSIHEIVSSLHRVGIPYHTIIPGQGGHHVVVVDEGGKKTPNIQTFAEDITGGIPQNQPTVTSISGSAKDLVEPGEYKRERSKAAYWRQIKAYEAKHGNTNDQPTVAGQPPPNPESFRDNGNPVKMMRRRFAAALDPSLGFTKPEHEYKPPPIPEGAHDSWIDPHGTFYPIHAVHDDFFNDPEDQKKSVEEGWQRVAGDPQTQTIYTSNAAGHWPNSTQRSQIRDLILLSKNKYRHHFHDPSNRVFIATALNQPHTEHKIWSLDDEER